MKFTTTTLTNPRTEILKYPDHYVAIPVTVDDLGIVANADGKKIIPEGTIVGAVASTLADDTQKVTIHVPATLTTALTGANNDLVVTAKINRTIKVEYIDPAGNSKALVVSVTADTISVSLATSGAGAITSTSAEIKAAIESNYLANNLVSVAHATSNTGVGVVTALTATALAGGIPAEGILLNDVDVTSGDMGGAMLIHGFIDTTKLPTAPSIQARADLGSRIVFID